MRLGAYTSVCGSSWSSCSPPPNDAYSHSQSPAAGVSGTALASSSAHGGPPAEVSASAGVAGALVAASAEGSSSSPQCGVPAASML